VREYTFPEVDELAKREYKNTDRRNYRIQSFNRSIVREFGLRLSVVML
jgi:hypothetical protein